MNAEIRDAETERGLRVRRLAQLADGGHRDPATGPVERAGANHDEDVLVDDVALGEVQRSAQSALACTQNIYPSVESPVHTRIKIDSPSPSTPTSTEGNASATAAMSSDSQVAPP